MSDGIPTPAFVINERKLEANIASFNGALRGIWSNAQLAYSVKTNSLPWILRKMSQEGVWAEVVSDEEYALALQCGYDDSRIIFNGPIKGESFIKKAFRGGAVVNLDSRADLDLCARFAECDSMVGLRVNVPTDLFDAGDIGVFDGGFRFGFDYPSGGFSDALEAIAPALRRGARIGLHLHCNSVTRSESVYRTIAKYAVAVMERFEIAPAFIDIGGGFFGGVEGKPTPESYLSAIHEELACCVDPASTMLFLEPGSALIGSTTDLVTSVLDVKCVGDASIVTTDGSRLHIDPLWKKNAYLYSLETSSVAICPKQVVCGYTCMDHDRIMTIADRPALQVGDRIIYHRVGAYSMTLGGMFIRYLPDVYVDGPSGVVKVRDTISVEDYIAINSTGDLNHRR